MFGLISFLCYLVAVVFFAFLWFSWNIADTDRLAAGLTFVALGLAFGALAGSYAYVNERRRTL